MEDQEFTEKSQQMADADVTEYMKRYDPNWKMNYTDACGRSGTIAMPTPEQYKEERLAVYRLMRSMGKYVIACIGNPKDFNNE
jgi:hypothetical protein